jgi:PPOX class probable F420-dependent enzyme
MTLSDAQLAFLRKNHSAAMVTTRADGAAHAVRVGIALVDDRIWSSGTQDRLRTRLLRRDPRCTLFVFDAGFGFLTLETTVTILEGPDVPELSVRMFQAMQADSQAPAPAGHLSWFGEMLTLDAFRQRMVAERRLIYQFEVGRAYGLTG